MAGRFARSIELAKASWSVVRADKELMLFPVMSVCALLLLTVSVAVPVVALGGLAGGREPAAGAWLMALVFYVLSYFVGIFFSTALVGAAMIRMDGGNPTVGDGLRIASQRVGRIFGYAVIAATVGLLLRSLEERVGWVGQVVVKLIGVGWALATFLVVPVLVTRDLGPVDSVKESAGLLRETWGENLIGTVGLGLAFFAVYLAIMGVAGVGCVLAAKAGLGLVAGLVALVGIAALVVTAVLQSTMQGVYSAALYRYATDRNSPTPGFPPELVAQAFRHK